jgi:hypothetical protein
MSRPLSPAERAIIDVLLEPDFAGRDQLVMQLATAGVSGPASGLGYPSLALSVDRSLPAAPVDKRVPTDGYGFDADKQSVGVLLHVVDGYANELEIYSTDSDESVGFPVPESFVRAVWSELDATGTSWNTNPPVPPAPDRP